jgi:acylphosphatase
MTNIRAHLIISGKVQGVGFRYFVRKSAVKLGVAGWVRNLEDGRVEAIFEGEEGVVASAIKFANQGPRFSKVENIELKKLEYCGEFNDFCVIS